jgi:parvulin-like peptidyl-prolyl isomerase
MTLPAAFPRARVLLPALALLASVAAGAADAPDTVLARRGDVVITRADWDAELLRIPAKDRADFASNLRRNYNLLERMLTTRELALEAKQKKLDADPMTRARVRQEEDRILAAALIASAEDAAARDFDLRQPVFERRARELYDIKGGKYATPETVMITALFFSAAKDGADGAERRAQAALTKIKGGTDIGDLAATLSDDPTTREIRGRKGPLAQPDLDATLARNVFALKNKGDVTDVTPTSEGTWIVRLDERKAAAPRPYEEVKGAILADLKQQQIDAARAAVLAAAGGGKEIAYNPPAIEALRPPPKATRGHRPVPPQKAASVLAIPAP